MSAVVNFEEFGKPVCPEQPLVMVPVPAMPALSHSD
jgi:hypothetical protein